VQLGRRRRRRRTAERFPGVEEAAISLLPVHDRGNKSTPQDPAGK